MSKSLDSIYLAPEVLLLRNIQPIVYGTEYFERYRLRAQTQMGFNLSAFRKTYAEIFTDKNSRILDFGCCYGHNVLTNSNWYGFDIIEGTKERLDNKFDHEYCRYKSICFFDVLEHLCEPIDMLHSIPQGTKLFVSIPLLPEWPNRKSLMQWRHWKPGEHFLYASVCGFEIFVKQNGYNILDHNMIETSLGRKDIHTYYLKKC